MLINGDFENIIKVKYVVTQICEATAGKAWKSIENLYEAQQIPFLLC